MDHNKSTTIAAQGDADMPAAQDLIAGEALQKILQQFHHVCQSLDLAQDHEIDATTASFARLLLKINTAQRRVMADDSTIFGDPAWNIMLDLFVSQHNGRGVTVGDACIASGAPTTTGLRYIERLVSIGLIERHCARHDARVKELRLTEAGFVKMTAMLSAGSGTH